MTDDGWIGFLVNYCDEKYYEEMKTRISWYLNTNIVENKDFSREDLTKSVCIHLDKIRNYNQLNSDWELYQNYFTQLNRFIENFVSKDTRAFKYYLRAKEISNLKVLTFKDFADYTRIILCLFTHIRKLPKGYVIIDNSFFIDYFDNEAFLLLLLLLVPLDDVEKKADIYLYNKNRFCCLYLILIYYFWKSHNFVNSEDLK